MCKIVGNNNLSFPVYKDSFKTSLAARPILKLSVNMSHTGVPSIRSSIKCCGRSDSFGFKTVSSLYFLEMRTQISTPVLIY
jgi:hypothetical protein